jgi:choline dehydrogenase
VGKPRGVGRLRFRSAEPNAPVDVESRFFFEPEDRARALEALAYAVELAQSKPLAELGTFFWPTARVARNPRRLEHWLQRRCGSGFHPSGTVPMGPEGAPEAATDGRGRVRGVEGLLVADASLMPTIPSANTNLPTLMIGERFGEWLRDGAV